MIPQEGPYNNFQKSPTIAIDIIIGSSRSVVIRPLAGILRFNSRAIPKPTTNCPETEIKTYFMALTITHPRIKKLAPFWRGQ